MLDLSTNQSIKELINNNFIKAVRRASVLLNDTSILSNNDIQEIALFESFPRILLRLSAVKDKDDNPVFGGIGFYPTYSTQYEAILKVITSPPFNFGIVRVAIALTAATALKSIPLNSEIKLFDSANSLESQSINDLDILIGYLVDSPSIVNDILSNSSSSSTSSSGKSLVSLYISNIISSISPPLVSNSLSIKPEYVGICWLFLSSLEQNNFMEYSFILENELSIESLVFLIASNINEATISSGTSLIASPNINTPFAYTLPNALISLNTPTYPISIHSIDISSRTTSIYFAKDLITLRLFQIPISLLNNDYSSDNLSLFKSKGDPIDGIKYGVIKNYESLTKEGPHSLLVNIEKGSYKSAQLGSSNTSDSSSNNSFSLNTFHFRLKEDYSLINGLLRIKVSTAPQLINISDWVLDFKNEDINNVVLSFHNSFYNKQLANQVLGSISLPNAVEMVSFILTDEEVKIIVDLIEIPEGLEVATGTPSQVITPYKNKARSINIPSRIKSTSDSSGSNNNDENNQLNKCYSNALITEEYHVSSVLNNLFNRIGEFRNQSRGQDIKGVTKRYERYPYIKYNNPKRDK